MEPETGISWEWELGIGWSVAGVEAFHAFNWKLRIHVESALAMPPMLLLLRQKRLTLGQQSRSVANCHKI